MFEFEREALSPRHLRWNSKPKSGSIIALDRALCLKHDPDTLAMNAIPARCSADLEDPKMPSPAWCGSLFLRAMRRTY